MVLTIFGRLFRLRQIVTQQNANKNNTKHVQNTNNKGNIQHQQIIA